MEKTRKRIRAVPLTLEHAMLGAQGFVVEILPNGIARGKFGDTTWRVIGNNLQVADKIEVQKVEGITLFVRKQ